MNITDVINPDEGDTAALVKQALGKDFSDVIYEGMGPDGIPHFFAIKDEFADKIFDLALNDEAELGRIMAKQILNYCASVIAHRNGEQPSFQDLLEGVE